MADYTPINNVDTLTSTASAAITGGQVLIVTGSGTVGPSAGASGLFVGVALHDAPSGGRVTYAVVAGAVHETVNGNAGTITAGNPISSGAAGNVDTGTLGTLAAAGTLMGTALTTALTGAKVRWIGR